MQIALASIALLISFYLLAKVCDEYFVGALDKLSKKLKLSSDAAGATLMAVGSSAPELFVSIMALVKPGDHEAIGAGTIVGSAIFNILVIIGASAAVKTAVVTWQPVVRDTVFYSFSIIALLVVFWDGEVNLSESLVFVGLYVIYVFAVINWRKILPYKDGAKEAEPEEEEKKKPGIVGKIMSPFNWLLSKCFPSKKHYIWIFTISILIIAALSWVLVESAVIVAEELHIPAAIIALTILAAGTSIPDLISSVIVAKQGRGDMAISNAVGSNIFDILIGLGVPWAIILIFNGGTVHVDNENFISSILLLFATVIAILFLLIFRHWKIGPKSGYLLIALYISYLVWAIIQI